MYCKLCDYHTDDRRNYSRHLKTKKHCYNYMKNGHKQEKKNKLPEVKKILGNKQKIKKLESVQKDTKLKNEHIIEYNSSFKFTCQFCNKTFKQKRYLHKHQKYHCHQEEEEDNEEEENKDELYLTIIKNNKQLQEELIKQNKKVEEKNGAIQKILLEGTKTLKENNKKIYDMSMKNQDSYKFILEHFKDAPNVQFPDDIEEQLFQNMGKYLEMENPVVAISKAFLDFIPKQPQEKRFIHGIDISRVKYVVKKDGKWNVDYYAKDVIPKFVFYFKKSCGRYVKSELKHIKEPEIFDTIKFMDGLDSKILSNKVARNVSFDLQLNKESYLERMIELHS